MRLTRQKLREMILAEGNLGLGAGLPKKMHRVLLSKFSPETITTPQQREEAMAVVRQGHQLVKMVGEESAAALFSTLVKMTPEQRDELFSMALNECGQLTETRLRQLISEIVIPPSDDATLMTVGQFRRLVREAAARGTIQHAANELARVGAVVDDLWDGDLKTRMTKALEDAGFNLDAIIDVEDEIELERDSRRDPHPAEDQYRDSVAAEETRPRVEADLASLLAANHTGPHLEKLLALKKLFSNASDSDLNYIVAELMDFPESVFA